MNDSLRPWVAGFLSLIVPGLGQLYLGRRTEAIGPLCVAIAAAIAPQIFHSQSTAVMMTFIYGATALPAARDAFRAAKGIDVRASTQAVGYVIMMLFVAGPLALPLLWQTPRLSQRAKVIWTIVVVVIAVVCVFFLAAIGPMMERSAQSFGLTP